MDFAFTDEQQLLADTVRRYLADHYAFDDRKRIVASATGSSTAVWKDFAELGLLALNVPEADGGLGGGAVETLVVATALGEALVVEPYLSSAVVATRLVGALGSPVQRATWLPALAAGEQVAVLAGETERGSAPRIRATRSGATWALNGRMPVVYHAPLADMLLVRAVGEGMDGADESLFVVARDAPGLGLFPCTTVDGQVAADVRLEDVVVTADARLGSDARAALSAAADFGVMALCAEALGALDRALALTVEYSRTRVQFGGPIGRFQALQHRMVDMVTHIEQSRSLIYLAASRCNEADVAAREAAVSAAKVVVSEAARYVGQQAVQLHGGMGVSDEVSISHYFKRLLAVEIRGGSVGDHLRRYAASLSAE